MNLIELPIIPGSGPVRPRPLPPARPRVGGSVFEHEGRGRGRPHWEHHASVVTSTILGFGLGILDVFTKVRPEKPNCLKCINT